MAAATWSPPAQAGSTLGAIVPELAKGLGSVRANTVVVAGPLESDVPAPKGDELASKIVALLAGKLGARAHDKPLALAAARSVAAGGDLVYVKVVLAKGQLRVTADDLPVVTNPWDRVRLPPPPPIAHAFAAASIDPEVRAALTPVLLEQASVHRFKHDETDVLAAACGDVDGDGGMELLLVSRVRVSLGRLRAGAFTATTSVPWRSLSGRAAVPLREPLAGATLGLGRVQLGSSDRAALWLDGSLTSQGTLRGLPIAGDTCARTAPESNGLGELLGCADGGGAAWTVGLKTFDAVSVYDGVDASGATSRALVAREASGLLHVRVGERPEVTMPGTGAQLALGDLDQDGVPELAASSDGEPDLVVVSSLDAAGPRERARFPAPEGVRALCTCPAEDRGLPALVAVVGSEVWLVR